MTELKVILLPNSEENVNQISLDSKNTVEDFKLISLPHSRTFEPVKYLLSHKTCRLYEFKQISGTNIHAKESNKLETDSGEPVKSMIIEENNFKKDDENLGIVNRNPTIYVATVFNIGYLLLSFFYLKKYHTNDSLRFSSLEDIIDSMEQLDNFENISIIPTSTIEEKLCDICEFIIENDEKFFKFSNDKTKDFLIKKIEKLANNFPQGILYNLVLPTITPADINGEINDSIIHVAKLKYSLNLIGSYLPNFIYVEISKSFDEEFKELSDYLKAQKDIKERKILAESSIDKLNKQTQEAAQRLGPKSKSKKVTTKKTTTIKKKVAKGALDMFFKKKAT